MSIGRGLDRASGDSCPFPGGCEVAVILRECRAAAVVRGVPAKAEKSLPSAIASSLDGGRVPSPRFNPHHLVEPFRGRRGGFEGGGEVTAEGG